MIKFRTFVCEKCSSEFGMFSIRLGPNPCDECLARMLERNKNEEEI